MSLARPLGALAATLLVATALGHVFLAATVSGQAWGDAFAQAPGALADRLIHFDFGKTQGGGCNGIGREYVPLCSSYPAATVADMLRERARIDVALLLGGLLFGTLAGIAGGRWCATRPDSKRTKALHVATAIQLSSPPFFQALLVLFYFSSNVSEFIRLPFLSGAGDYATLDGSVLAWLKAMWTPWLLVSLPLAAFVLRITEASMRDILREDYVRTARAKGLRERRIVDRHALPVALPSITAMTGVNVSTLLLNVAVIEYAFAIPGMFRVIVTAVLQRDVPVLEAMIFEGVFLIVLANALADAVGARLDPRVRLRA
jgi:peptide/nickel transport system permease protein